jgi:hypothetical protein
MVLLGAPLFDSKVDLSFWLQWYMLLWPLFQTSCNFDIEKKMMLLVPLFNLKVDFKVLVSNITRLLRTWL